MGLIQLWAAFALVVGVAGLAETHDAFPYPVPVEVFYSPGCAECQRVKDEVLPDIAQRFEGYYTLLWADVGVTSNMMRLIAYQKALGTHDRNEPVSMVVDGLRPLVGFDEIRDGLAREVQAGLDRRLQPGWTPSLPTMANAAPERGARQASEAARAFALTAVLAGGFVDGINPCAISTLVFFMSLLAVARVRGRDMLAMGIAFCAASFVVYTALGFGLLHLLRSLAVFPSLRMGINGIMMAVLGVLAVLSFRDAWRFARSRDPKAITLQLPDTLKDRIHAVMRSRVRGGSLVGAGLAIGAAVTVLESVCTGQVYVPTLVVVIRSGQDATRAWGYLLLYNVMFMVPLVTVFVLAYLGLRTEALLRWSRENVVSSKILLGCLFAVLLAFMVML